LRHCVISYAHQNNVLLYNPGHVAGRDDAKLNEYLSSGNPVIIGVNPTTDPGTGRRRANHFVVATGKVSVNGQETYTINDPIHGETTLYAQWGNDYLSILLLSNTESDRRTIRISAHSPVELLVTDPQGRKSGYDPVTGTFWHEIPEAEYFVNSIGADGGTDEILESKVLLIYAPLDGDYTVSVLGTDEGEYEIDTYATTSLGQVSQRVFTGTAQPGSVDDLLLHYSSDMGVLPNFIYLPIIRK